MTPILYEKNETDFNHNGLGRLRGLIVNEIEEVLNGEFEAFLEYPASGDLADKIDNQMLIKLKPNRKDDATVFRIYEYDIDITTGDYIIYARHKNMDDLASNMILDLNIRQQTPSGAWNQAQSNALDPVHTQFYSDITATSSTEWTRRSLMNCIAGEQGSMIQYWGGEIKHGTDRISLYRRRGQDNVATVRHGKNLDGLTATYSTKGLVTAIVPYHTYRQENTDNENTIYGDVVQSQYIENYPRTYYDTIEYNDEDLGLDNEATEAQRIERLNEVADRWFIENTGKDLPSVNMEIDLIDLSQTKEYEKFKDFEQIEIGDTITVYSKKYNVHVNAKVRRVVYDGLTDMNKEIEVGTVSRSIYDDYQNMVDNRMQEVREQVDAVRVSANGKNVNIYGTVDPNEADISGQNGDNYFRQNGQEDEIWLFQDGMWHKVYDSADTTKNADAIEEQKKDIDEAKKVADDAVNEINTAVENAGFTSLDETIGHVDNIASAAQSYAQQAITEASNAFSASQTALEDAKTAKTNAQTAITKADEAQGLATDLSGQVSDFEVTVDGFNQVVNDYEGQVSGFRNDIAGMESTVANYEVELDEYGAEVSRYATEVSTLNNTVDGFESTVGNYQTELLGYREDVTKYQNQVSTMNNTVNGFNSTVAKYTTEVDEFGNEVDAYATQVSTLENTVSGFKSSVDKVEKDYQGVSETVAKHTTSISNLNGQIALKANTSTVNTLTGRVSTAETGITANANAIKLKASQSSVDTLSGRVNTLGAQIDVTAGQISSKVWMTDIDDIEIGGRNLLRDTSNELKSHSKTGWDWDIHDLRQSDLDRLNIGVGDELTLRVYINNPSEDARTHIQFTLAGPIYRQYHGNNILKGQSGWSELTIKITSADLNNLNRVSAAVRGSGNSAGTIRISNKKLEKGNKATDWTPAPEDTDAKINHVESELTQKHDSIVASVASTDGRVAAQKVTLDSISSTVSGHGGRLSSVEQTASGLQTTVASKASQSQVTQLANGLSSVVTDLGNVPGQNLLLGSSSDWYVNQWAQWNSYVGYNGDNGMYGIRVVPGETYTASAMFREISSGAVTVHIFWILENGSIQESGGNDWINSGSGGYASRTQTAPSNAVRARYVLRRNTGGSSVTNAKVRHEKFEKGDRRTPWEPASPAESQISQLSNNINLRVKEGDVLSQINIEAGRTLIQSKKLVINASNTVITGTAWMDGAVIKNASIDGAKIQNATIGSAKIASLDVGKISGNTTNFVQSNWNSAAGGNVRITGSGIVTTASDNSQTYIQNGIVGTRNPNGATIGQIGYINDSGSPSYTISTSWGSHFKVRQYRSGSLRDSFALLSGGYDGYINTNRFEFTGNQGVHFYNQLTLQNDLNANNYSIYGVYDVQLDHGGYLRTLSSGQTRLSSSGGMLQLGVSGSWKLNIDSTYLYAHVNLSMEGNDITNQSDERLKTNILDHQESSLDKISRFNFVDFEWVKSGRADFGVIAQQVQQVAPDLILEGADGYLSVNNSLLNMMTTHAVQQLALKHDAVETTVNSHTDTIHTLQQELSQANRKIQELEEQIA